MLRKISSYLFLGILSILILNSCEDNDSENNNGGETGNPIRYPDTLIEYLPAPGQFINVSPGLPSNAQSIIGGEGLITLGGYGGYIVVGFNKPIVNADDNLYGVDFTIVGNAYEGNSEPGIVMVMQDKNHNGKADEEWYELQGEEHSNKSTISDYEVTYYYINDTLITWKDNQGESDTLLHNAYHSQSYYPSTNNYPNSNNDSITFTGTKLVSKTYYNSSNGYWISPSFGYGYADNLPINSNVAFNQPDNPATDSVEGCGGNAFDIDWAVDANGNSVTLDSIYFIKVYCGVFDANAVTGEVSTEIRAIVPVK